MLKPVELWQLAELCLTACDASYFRTARPGDELVSPLPSRGDPLAQFFDEPGEPVNPFASDAWHSGFVMLDRFLDRTTGFGAIVYARGPLASPQEYIVAFRGTDGLDPQDWRENFQQLGWSQWDKARAPGEPFGRVFATLASELLAGKRVHFTGQSLGGALAQYAAVSLVSASDEVASRAGQVTLTTCNSLGGLWALMDDEMGKLEKSRLDAIARSLGSVAHYWIPNDLVIRLGGGHLDGQLLELGGIRQSNGRPFDPVTGHRIESGFYANMSPGGFAFGYPEAPEYLQIQNLQKVAGLLGGLFNGATTGRLESLFRLPAGVIGALALGDPKDVDTLAQAVIKAYHDSGDLGEGWYRTLRRIDFGAVSKVGLHAGGKVVAGIYGVSIVGAALADAVTATFEALGTVFDGFGRWLQRAFEATPADAVKLA